MLNMKSVIFFQVNSIYVILITFTMYLKMFNLYKYVVFFLKTLGNLII